VSNLQRLKALAAVVALSLPLIILWLVSMAAGSAWWAVPLVFGIIIGIILMFIAPVMWAISVLFDDSMSSGEEEE